MEHSHNNMFASRLPSPVRRCKVYRRTQVSVIYDLTAAVPGTRYMTTKQRNESPKRDGSSYVHGNQQYELRPTSTCDRRPASHQTAIKTHRICCLCCSYCSIRSGRNRTLATEVSGRSSSSRVRRCLWSCCLRRGQVDGGSSTLAGGARGRHIPPRRLGGTGGARSECGGSDEPSTGIATAAAAIAAVVPPPRTSAVGTSMRSVHVAALCSERYPKLLLV